MEGRWLYPGMGETAMKIASRILLYALAASFTLALSGSAFAQAKTGELKLEPRVFESASGQKVDAEFGRLAVPENRSKPGSRLIQLAFVRFKSTATNPGPPIVYLAGGPGSSGIGAARGTRFPLPVIRYPLSVTCHPLPASRWFRTVTPSA